MDFIEKQVVDSAGNPLGRLKYAQAEAFLPFGCQKFEIHFLNPQGQEIGGIKSTRLVPFQVLVVWKDIKGQYADELTMQDAVGLAEEIFKQDPKDHDDLVNLMNDFGRGVIEKKSKSGERG